MLTVETAIKSEKFSHARFKRWCGVDQVHIYHFDGVSPSGFILAATASGAEEVGECDRLLKANGRAGALSPVESR